MPLTGRHEIDNTPNTGLPFQVQTSFNPQLFTSAGSIHGGGDAGFGSKVIRDVATELVMYKAYRNSLDTLIQTTGGFDIATNSVHEWIENDELLPDESTIEATNLLGSSTSGTITVGTSDGVIYRVGDVVRYVSDAGAYEFAHVSSISGDVLTLNSITGSDLAEPDDDNGIIQRMHSLRGSDLNYDVQPRSTIPSMYFTYINKLVHDARVGSRWQNEEHYYNSLLDTENKLFNEMRRSRELQALYGVQGKFNLSNGDVVYSSPGLYTQIAEFNKDTADMTNSGVFDKNKFIAAMYRFIEHNYGAESGGPDERTMFISGKFASYLSQAFIDRQRFYEVEYIAGVRAMRWEHNLGNIDFVYAPVMDYKHPLVGGSLKEGNGKAVGMLLPVGECVERLVMQGEGPVSETFYEKGGDEEQNMRVKSTEGLKLKLKQYCGVLEEI